MELSTVTPKVFKPQRKIALTLLLGIFLGTGLISYFVIRDTVTATVEAQAVAFAEIAAVQATSARSVYAKEIAEKLRLDGTGPNVEYDHMKGYVPIPAQFLKMLGLASAADTANLFHYKPVSKWNLEASQGLDDDFLRWAWPQVEQQDRADPSGPIAWQPVWRFEQQGGQRVLRYLRPDAASQAGCVACHNAYEGRPEIIARRIAQKVPAGKQWKQHQLLGAISITIPLKKVEDMAAARVRETSILIFAILLTSLLVVIWFSRRLTKQEVSLVEAELNVRRSEKEAKDAKELLYAKHDLEQAFKELSAYMQAIDQHAIVSIADPQGRIIQVNQKFCDISGYSQEELLGKNHRIVNSGHHPKAFFANMWSTIASGNIWHGECCNRNKSGALYWVDSTIVPHMDSNGHITKYISIRMDITQRKLDEDRMTHFANHDALTGLPNRLRLAHRFELVLAQCRREKTQAAVMFIDLDKFKPINDTYGHKVGDLVLIEVTKRLQSCVRQMDTVSRHGGDEFIVLLAGVTHAADVAVVARKLLDSLAEPYLIMDNELRLSASVGIAFSPVDGEDMETLLKHSDLAMYSAKQNGSNNFQFYTPSML
jgi:diguanylate cyclase (GGDEF)-like protein/PAS domain S-box-containing protein